MPLMDLCSYSSFEEIGNRLPHDLEDMVATPFHLEEKGASPFHLEEEMAFPLEFSQILHLNAPTPPQTPAERHMRACFFIESP